MSFISELKDNFVAGCKGVNRPNAYRKTAKGLHSTADGLRRTADYLDKKADALEVRALEIEKKQVEKMEQQVVAALKAQGVDITQFPQTTEELEAAIARLPMVFPMEKVA